MSKINKRYYNRYVKFIHWCNRGRTLPLYYEKHHIVPRCIGGTDNDSNLINLSMREHFLAHWLLWKAYPSNFSLKSAFLQMVNKNPKTDKPFQGRITSRVYETLKADTYKQMSDRMSGKVYVKDNGVLKHITTDEYKSGKYSHHLTDKVRAFDTETNEWKYVSTNEYNTQRYISRFTDISVRTDYQQLAPYFDTARYKIAEFDYRNCDTGELIKLSRAKAAVLNRIAGKKQYVQRQNKLVKCVAAQGDIVSIPLAEYDTEQHTSILKGMLSVFDTVTQCYKSIHRTEYNKDPIRYITSTKGKVLAKNKSGNNVLITKDEFKSGNYFGQTKGLTTVLDKETGQYIQISKAEFKKNREKYQGPSSGKINVINIITGVRSQILKTEFDSQTHLPLGNKKFLFKCRNVLTHKEKYINIYEWKLVFNQYFIIEKEKFNTLTDYIQ